LAFAWGAVDVIVAVAQAVGWILRVALIVLLAVAWCWSHVRAAAWHHWHHSPSAFDTYCRFRSN
jgi:hypothetical protein